MNSAVITKIEYKPVNGSTFTEIEIIPHSGNFLEIFEETRAGKLFSAKSEFKIAKIDSETDELMQSLAENKNTFNLTDSNGFVHSVGDSAYRAKFNYSRHVDGAPGAFNGYICTITRTGPNACPVSAVS